MRKKILFIVPYPVDKSPSQRFRFEQYLDVVEIAGHRYRVRSFLDSQNWLVFSKDGNGLTKLKALMKGLAKRIFDLLFLVPFHHIIFIHREAAPVGPPVFEWIVRFVFHKKLIYDFDDSIWMTDNSEESAVQRALKWRSKVRSICRYAFLVTCSNEYLMDFARQFAKEVIYLPTTIDTEHVHNPANYAKVKSSNVTIGWTGSYSTLKYLKFIEEPLAAYFKESGLTRLLVIADRPPELSFPFDFVPWRSESEIDDLLRIDIGIMPLPDDNWTKGKGGFKCLQYMALGIPPIASAVGVNKSIIDHGRNGFLVNSASEWKTYLDRLVSDPSLREKLGKAAREEVVERYSKTAFSPVFLSLFTNSSIKIKPQE